MNEKIEDEVKKYEKIAEEYKDNEFFEDMEDANLAINQLFVLLEEKKYKIVEYNTYENIKKDLKNVLDIIRKINILDKMINKKDFKILQEIDKGYKSKY